MLTKLRRKRSPYQLMAIALCLLLLVGIPSALFAFDSRSGDMVTIGADEVVDDDLFVGAQEFVLDGTVTGDLFVGGTKITINGTVGGDLFAGGQQIVVNGEIQDDIIAGAAVLTLGPTAIVAGDVLMGGQSMETKADSTIGGDVYMGGMQALLAGTVARDVNFGGNGLQIDGQVGGSVNASVGASSAAPPFNPGQFMPDAPEIPSAPGGLTISDAASIAGNVSYESSSTFSIPEGAVAGAIEQTISEVQQARQAPAIGSTPWILDHLRSFLSLLIIGLLLLWIVPRIVRGASRMLTDGVLAGFGWGLAVFVLTPLVLLLVIVLAVALAMLFGWLSLGGVSAALIMSSIAVVIAGAILFGLILGYFGQIIFGLWSGEAVLRGMGSQQPNVILAMIIGLLIVAILAAIPFAGGIISFLLALVGLGAIWMWIRNL